MADKTKKILIINKGSSSLKCSLYQFDQLPEKPIKPVWEENDNQSLNDLLKKVPADVDIIGHRIVQGGKEFRASVIIDDNVKRAIRKLGELAPLHNEAELEAIEAVEKLFKGKRQVAVFDTAFHRTLPPAAAVYPGPYKWFEEGIERFGFHGISFQYVLSRVEELIKTSPKNLKILACHLGAGASLCAIKEGKSIDTTMGFTPLEGLMMNTRCGSVDPGILLHLLKKQSLESLTKQLYEESGLLGLSGSSEDMREIIKKVASRDERAQLAFDVYMHRLNSCIGSMMASLQGLDVLIFTGGIGENIPLIRKKAIDAFSFLDIKFDEKLNEQFLTEDRDLTLPSSKIKVLLVHTQEAFQIAKECFRFL